MMILALIGSSLFGAVAGVVGVLSMGLAIWAGFALYLGIALIGIGLAVTAQIARHQAQPGTALPRAT